MPESTQHKLDRIRPPRVQITYDVETRGSFVKKELPFVVGIMADLSGKGTGAKQSEDPNRPALRERKYLEIDRDNFNDIMRSIAPCVTATGQVGANAYTFESLEDFTPIRLLKPANPEVNEVDAADRTSKLGIARTDFSSRTRLSDVVAKLDGNVPLQGKFIAQLKDATQREAFKAQIQGVKDEAEARIRAHSGDNAGGAGTTGTATKVEEKPAEEAKADSKKEDKKK